LAGGAHQGAAGGEDLEAPAVAAAAARPVRVQDDVADLAARAEAAAQQLVAGDGATADAGPDGDQRHGVGVRGGPGAVAVLAPGGGVRVVLHDDGASQSLLHLTCEVDVPPGQVRCEPQVAVVTVDEPGAGETDSRHGTVSGLQQLGGQPRDGSDDPHGVLGGRRLRAVADASAGVDEPAGQLRPADVDADGGCLPLGSAHAPLPAPDPAPASSSCTTIRSPRSVCGVCSGVWSRSTPSTSATPSAPSTARVMASARRLTPVRARWLVAESSSRRSSPSSSMSISE